MQSNTFFGIFKRGGYGSEQEVGNPRFRPVLNLWRFLVDPELDRFRCNILNWLLEFRLEIYMT